MHVLLVALGPTSTIQERWEKLGIRATYVPPARLIAFLRAPMERKALLVDAVVLLSEPFIGTGELETPVVINLPTQIRGLPEDVAMPDGRRWSAVPIVLLAERPEFELAAGFTAHLSEVGFAGIHVHELYGQLRRPSHTERSQELSAARA
jgi:hypothetical protein